MSLTQAALHSLKWSFLGEIAAKSIGPLMFIILARILVPEDFGVIAAATVVISFSQIFWDAGFAKALVQRQERITESANVVFWLNLSLGFIMLLALVASADLIASFFHDSRIAQVVRVLGLLLPLAASASVHTALLQRDFRFKKLFWIRLITTSAPALASIPLAMLGAGYWALVAGTLTGQVAQTLTLWRMSHWRPNLSFDRTLAMELWHFGRWVMLSAILGWFYMWMDAIIVGHFLGSHDMGLYRTGNTFATMVFGLFFSPLLPVLYSLFSRTQQDLHKLRETLLFVVKGIALIALPISFGIFTFRVPIAGLVFGARWDGVSSVIGLMALVQGFSYIVGANGEVYRAIGKPHLETLPMLIMLVVYSAVYLASIQYGLTVFMIARLALVSCSLFVHMWIATKYILIAPSKWGECLKPLLYSLLTAGVLWRSALYLSFSMFGIAVQVFIASVSYLLLVILLERPYINSLGAMLRYQD